MIRAYSKRLLAPFNGQVQIIESDKARARTLDGIVWEIQFMVDAGVEFRNHEQRRTRARYLPAAMVREGKVQRVELPPFVDRGEVTRHVDAIVEHMAGISLPLPAADSYEYWLLDEQDEQPLALIYSCVEAEEMPLFPVNPEWTALPASMMEVTRLPEEQGPYQSPPVNYRLELRVNERAGKHPRARWIRRREGLDENFPACLVREDWDDDDDRRLCERYIQRQAPRLLTLHGLEPADRQRLEVAAKQNALEVDRYFHLYPEVIDEKLMSAIRVEARLRRAAEPG